MTAAFAASPLRGLVRFGALAAIAAGALRIASTFILYEANSAPLETLYAGIDLGLMFGLLAIYTAHAGSIGAIGLAGFVVALAGIASIVGPDAPAFGIDFYRMGALTFVGGLALMAAALLRAGELRLVSVLWLATPIASLSAMAWPPAFMAAGVLLGAGYAAAGIALLRTAQRRVSPQPA